MSARPHSRGGLSLVELLAAVIVLSIVAATGVSILREMRLAQDSWQHRSRAPEVLDQWRAEQPDAATGEVPNIWITTDDSGAQWRVSVTESDGAQSTHAEESRLLDVAFRLVTVQRTGASGVSTTEFEVDLFVEQEADPSEVSAP
ncbi:MAG: prepilin-type N-terminal cleavage/methylation domain-containing protein [Phycisphaerales bacterium]